MGGRSGWLGDPILHILLIVLVLALVTSWRSTAARRRAESPIEVMYTPEHPRLNPPAAPVPRDASQPSPGFVAG